MKRTAYLSALLPAGITDDLKIAPNPLIRATCTAKEIGVKLLCVKITYLYKMTFS